MMASWPAFIGGALGAYVAICGFFALLYAAGDNPIHGLPEGEPFWLFYFSVGTLTLAGAEGLYPQTHYAYIVASAEGFLGIFSIALLTGLIFARFSRPRARILFAENPVVTLHDGKPTLMLRIANVRLNLIGNATAKMWLVRIDQSVEGQRYRRFHDLRLFRTENPVFMLSWTLFHVIDETSPLYGRTSEDLAKCDASVVVAVHGTDENSAQQVHSRFVYDHGDILWNHCYVDILEPDGLGGTRINYDRFHAAYPDGR